jgi:glycosyltransferase involved in cell wall biosynthesis
MRLLYIADGRSPIALSWIKHFIEAGHEVHLASTFPCDPPEGIASIAVIPIAMSELYGGADWRNSQANKSLRRLLPVGLRTKLRQLVAPITFPRATRSLLEVINRLQPELVHAMRIPFEGMITSRAIQRLAGKKWGVKKPVMLVSVWGNDFTLHARSTRMMQSYTRQTLQVCQALHTDCQRDQLMAIELGFDATKPKFVLPGGGGVHLDVFYPAQAEPEQHEDGSETGNGMVTIINPRGFRAYVRNDTFFQAIPQVIERHHEVRFLCPGMLDEAQAQKWIAELGIGEVVELLPFQSQQQLAELFRRSQICLSITTHDGTPNSLLEAMACGCFPIAGDIESLREWISPGVNGLLVDPDEPEALAGAILSAIDHPELRHKAKQENVQLIQQRAEYHQTMQTAEEIYYWLVRK